MTDDTYPPEWADQPPPHPDDPRLGEALRPWRPHAATGARVCELLCQYVAGDPAFTHSFLNFCGDTYADKTVPQIVLAFCEIFHITAIGSQGLDLTLARLAGDLEHAREDALREAK